MEHEDHLLGENILEMREVRREEREGGGRERGGGWVHQRKHQNSTKRQPPTAEKVVAAERIGALIHSTSPLNRLREITVKAAAETVRPPEDASEARC